MHGVTALKSLSTIYRLPPALVERAAPLFATQSFDQPFRDAVFEGRLSVPVVVDDPLAPTAALLCHPFYFFLAGCVHPALRAFLNDAPEESGVFAHYYAYATDDPDWRDALAADREAFMVLDRRDFKWPAGQPALAWRAHLPDGAALVRIDGALAERIDRTLNEHISANWGDYATFDAYGDGLALLLEGQIACAAYTCGASRRQANIGIVTAEAYRGRGLATLTCSAFIDHLTARGLQPTWCTDAINTASGRLAEKLGFVEDRPYWQVGPHWGERLALTRGLWLEAPPTAEGVAVWQRVDAA
jgi:RimJ/RimL family protein N-acetyltransferase